MSTSIIKLILFVLIMPISVVAWEIDLTQGCSQSRWIGIKTSQTTQCPNAPNWRVSTLFDIYDNLRNRRLEQFCVFERQKQSGEIKSQRTHQTDLPNELRELIAQGLLEDNLQQDCSVVDASAALKPDVLLPLEKQFLYQTDRLSVPEPKNETYPVRLAILDTLPTSASRPWAQPTHSPHGISLALLLQKLLCDSSNRQCAAKITSQLALAYIVEQGLEERIDGGVKDKIEKSSSSYLLFRDDVKGGFFGSISDLARAIRREVLAWKTDKPNSRLILNLSLGWNGDFWGGTGAQPSQFGADIQSVYYALSDASCHGALILSAAGNQGNDDSKEQGPLVPASWESLPAPSSEECFRLTGVTSKQNSPNDPLVYAVAGIDSLGQPLNNSRSKALPKLFAYGDHAIVNSSYNGTSQVLTGTSVATAVMSAAAATAWSSRPELTSHELMYLIYRSGETLDFNADFSGTRYGGLQTKKISMCSALYGACEFGRCDLPSECSWPKTKPSLSGSSIVTDPAQSVHSLSSLTRCSLTSDPGCVVKQLGSRTISPWVVPQPDSDPCPNCIYMDSTDSIFMEFNASFIGSISDAQLVIGNNVYTIPAFNVGDRVILEHVQPSSPNDQLWLSVLINNSYRENIPLLHAN